MISTGEAARSLYGAYRLALFDAGGLKFFGSSIKAFRHSFYAAVLVAPLFALVQITYLASGAVEAPLPRFIAVESIAYVIAWVLYPVLLLAVTEVMNLGEKYIDYIVAYNWTSAIQNAVILPLYILGLSGALPQQFAAMASFLSLGYVFAYSWFVARRVLKISPGAASGLVILDFFISILLGTVADVML